MIIFIIIGVFFGYFIKTFIIQRKKQNIELEIGRMKLDAEKEVLILIQDGKDEKNRIIKEGEEKNQKKEKENIEKKRELVEKEEKIIQQEIKISELELKLNNQLSEVEKEKIKLSKRDLEQVKELESIAGITRQEALNKIYQKLEEENKEDLFLESSRLDNEKRKILEEKSKEILAQGIQKYSNEVNNAMTTTVVKIESEDEKGKIIGKEGRNIRTFERVTGVQLLIDESPNSVTISSFDPIRREIANRVLLKLLDDGIVQPAKIEEYHQLAVEEVVEIIREKGENAAKEVELYNLDPELMEILGRLYFRTSYGQNVLQHSLEMAHIAGVIAEELGADVRVVKTAALFHDIGKAVDFETEGTHVEIGRRILKQYKISDKVIMAMQSHHNEYPNENIESYIIDAADKISGARPGARSDNAEMYIKKLQGLERITSEFKGVQEAYALSAGREVRVFVKPEEVNDFVAKKMARQIALKIEEELQYPGEIKVAVIREKKIITFAR